MISYNKQGKSMASKKAKYISKYNKANYKMYQFRVRKSDTDLIEKLDGMENRSSYIKNLILRDIKPGCLTFKQIKERIRPVVEKHHIEEVYLFGSYARGEAGPDSDVDIYCSSGDIETLYGEMDLIDELEQALGKKVDLVTIGSQMHEFFRKQLEEDKIRIC